MALPAGVLLLPRQPLLGTANGLNKVFRASVPFISGDSLREVVYRNGVRVAYADYTADPSSRTITFLKAPQPGDVLLLDAYVETTR